MLRKLSASMGTFLISFPVLAGDLPVEITADALLNMAHSRQIILVDVRFGGEKPAMPALPNATTARIAWPGGPYSSADNQQHVDFYRQLRSLQRSNEGIPIVLVCGIGQRSATAIRHAKDFGLRSGISHVIGGLDGNTNDPGMILELAVR